MKHEPYPTSSPRTGRSIRTRLISIFLLIIIVPMAATTYTHTRYMTDVIEGELEQRGLKGMQAAKKELERYSSRAVRIARMLAEADDVKNNMTSAYIGDALTKFEELWAPAIIEVYDSGPTLLSRMGVRQGDNNRFQTEIGDPILRDTMDFQFLSDIYETADGLALKASAPIVNLNTLDLYGMVVVTFPLELRFVQLLKDAVKTEVTIQYSTHGSVVSTLLDEKGQALKTIWPEALSGFTGAIEQLPESRHENIHGGRYAVAYAPLKNSSGRILGLLSTAVDFATVEKSKHAAVKVVLISSGIAGILAVVVGLLTALSFTKPIYQLLSAMRKVSEGRLEKRVYLKQRDEIGALAMAFNEMAETIETSRRELVDASKAKARYAKQLERSNKKLESFNSELEHQVAERTKALRDANTKLKELDNMKTDFLSTVSHELRTPLTSILGFAKIIQKRLQKSIFPHVDLQAPKAAKAISQVGENLEIILAEGERLTVLINDVLDIAKMEAGKVVWKEEGIYVPEVIERAVNATSALLRENQLKLEMQVEPDLPEIIGDRDRLIQVLINLLSNAVKFTTKGSIACSAKRVGGEIQVSIKDQGIGISPEDLENVFEKFRQVGDTLTDKPGGTGLGLSICRQIITHHGGRIWAESELDQGSTFSFTLPVRQDAIVRKRAAGIDELLAQVKQYVQSLQPKKATGGNTILVVDDDPAIRRLLREVLDADGYQVREARDGMEALNLVKEVRPDLIVLDVMMPRMNGFDVAAVLKNDPTTRGVPIIILSVVNESERGDRLGVDRYLTKPVDVKTLNLEVQQLLAFTDTKIKILVVDNHQSTVKSLADELNANGYQVTEALNADDCIQKALDVKPNMIILNSMHADHDRIVTTLRTEKSMDNIVFFMTAGNELHDKA